MAKVTLNDRLKMAADTIQVLQAERRAALARVQAIDDFFESLLASAPERSTTLAEPAAGNTNVPHSPALDGPICVTGTKPSEKKPKKPRKPRKAEKQERKPRGSAGNVEDMLKYIGAHPGVSSGELRRLWSDKYDRNNASSLIHTLVHQNKIERVRAGMGYTFNVKD